MAIRYVLRCVSTLVLFLLSCTIVHAQQATGTITGTITHQQGAVVQGATVEVLNVATNAKFDTKTNESGFYNAQNLPVGEYTISASATGFKRAVRTGIGLQVAQNAQINITLDVGQVAETVEVQAQATLVDTGGATLGAVIENRRVRDLPLNGRNALALTLLNAGVISNAGPTNSGFGDRGVQISSLSINGSPSSMDAQMLDGNNNILSYVGEVGVPPAVDSVEEFKVQSGTMSSEYGFTAGGSINLVTKSGTNQFHGTLYEFFRNDKLDARNTFAARKLPLRYNQFGGSLGAPIIKNRTFGFVNLEEYRLRQSTPRISSVPIAAWRQGDFSNYRTAQGQLIPIYDPRTTRPNPNGQGQIRDQFPNNIIPTNRFDPITRKILDFWPLPNKTSINEFTQSQNFEDQSLNRTNWTQQNYRVDHRFSDRNSIFFRYTHARHQTGGNSIYTDPTVGQNREDLQINRNIMLSDTHTFSPTLLSNLRVGAMRQAFDFRAINAGQDWPSKLGLPPSVPNDQFPQIDFGFGLIGGQAYGARGSLNWDIQETLTWIVSSHTLKFGYNHRILQGSNRQGSALSENYIFAGLTSNPQVPAGTGSALAQFLLGDVGSASIDRILGNSWHGFAASGFVQDDWRVSRRLTLNLGLRYDFQQKPYERNNGQINFDSTARVPGTPFIGATVYAGVDGQPRQRLGPALRLRVRRLRHGQDSSPRWLRHFLPEHLLPHVPRKHPALYHDEHPVRGGESGLRRVPVQSGLPSALHRISGRVRRSCRVARSGSINYRERCYNTVDAAMECVDPASGRLLDVRRHLCSQQRKSFRGKWLRPEPGRSRCPAAAWPGLVYYCAESICRARARRSRSGDDYARAVVDALPLLLERIGPQPALRQLQLASVADQHYETDEQWLARERCIHRR